MRKPRVLKALSVAPAKEGKAPVDSEEQITPESPNWQFARIRAWVE